MQRDFKKFSKNIAYLVLCVLLLLNVSMQSATADTYTESAFENAERKQWDVALMQANRSSEKGIYNLMMWMALMDGNAEIPATSIRAFIESHNDWPDLRKMQLRYEQALLNENTVPEKSMLDWFKKYPPISGAGKLLQARSMLDFGGSAERAKVLIRDAWVNGDFVPEIERDILLMHGKLFDAKLHEARADRLLWEGQYSAVKRLFPLLSSGYQHLSEARIALETRDKKAPVLFAKVPANLKNNAGLSYARLVWRDSRQDTSGAMEMLLSAPKKNLIYPEKWWNFRQQYVRDLIDKKQYAQALKLLKHHGLESGADFAEAVWLKGWIMLEFQQNPADAYREFNALFYGVNYSVSKARAAYWAGRAAEQLKQPDMVRSWYQSAAAYPTTFYGQLAYTKINKGAPLKLTNANTKKSESYSKFKSSELARALMLCMDYNRIDVAARLIHAMVDDANSPEQMRNIAFLASDRHSHFLGVKAAKRALQYNVLFEDIAYPTLDYHEVGLESPLAHAIIRQESEFNPEARSRSGALGYMQLLTGTAKEVAKKLGMSTSGLRITHPATNVKLGSTYLSKLIDGFNGSYVLAIASYNAGPGRVRGWTKEFGVPSRKMEEAVNWIEKIPYSETRNYVQRVLENLQVYRVILGGEKGATLKLEQDLIR